MPSTPATAFVGERGLHAGRGAAGLTWIGPPAATQEALGNKLAARRAAADAGAPVVPGLLVALDADAVPDLDEIGFR